MCYKYSSEYLIKEVYINDLICPCVFFKKSKTGFDIIEVYVDDINLIGTPKELSNTAEYLKEFEVKDLGKIELCLSLELKFKANRIIVHQSAYMEERILKLFYMDKTYPLSTPTVVRSLES